MSDHCVQRRTGKLSPSSSAGSDGFSLLEVVITIAILMSLTIAVAAMLRGGFDVKQGLSERARVVHRLANVMGKLANDVGQTFFVSVRDTVRNGLDRNMKTTFRLEKSGLGGDKLTLTTTTHQPIKAGVHESEFTLVSYELRDSKDAPGRKDLYRSESPAIPLDLREQQPSSILARNIKTLNIQYWRGDGWSTDYWDTQRGDTRGRLPKLVKITVEAWVKDRRDGDGQDPAQADEVTDKLSTVVFLQSSLDFQELKEQDKSIKWGAL